MSNSKESTKAILYVRRNVDGVIRKSNITWDYWGDFIWEEGNFSCDCNRAAFFAEAEGEDGPEDPPCGDNAFSVMLTTMDGYPLYNEL